MENYLAHYGVKGMKWGVRKDKVFVSGSSKTQFKKSGYYRKSLHKKVRNELDSFMKKGDRILIGEAPGIDTQVQRYLKSKNYKNVTVYTSFDKPRFLADTSWKVKKVNAKGFAPGSSEHLRQKDIAMTNDSSKGFAVVLENGGAGATRNNVQRLINQNKDVKVFELGVNDDFINDLKTQFDLSIKIQNGGD